MKRLIPRALPWTFAVGASALAIWGLRATVLEGFVYASPRFFYGDFDAAMFGRYGSYWDGTGILYGPLFVMEWWATRIWPDTFDISFFAYTNIPIAIVAYTACLLAGRYSPVGALGILAGWLAFSPLRYSFSIAANPEFIELAAIAVAWYCAVRRYRLREGVAIATGVVAKLAPLVFALGLLARQNWRGLIGLFGVWLVLGVIVGVGQGLSAAQTLHQMLLPFGVQDPTGAGWLYPYLSREFSSLNSAIARTFVAMLSDTGDASTLVGRYAFMIQTLTLAAYFLAAIATSFMVVALARTQQLDREVSLAMSYALITTLMTLLLFAAHPHAFLFLLPVVAMLPRVLRSDPDRRRRLVVAVFFGAVWVLIGFPTIFTAIDRISGGLAFAMWWQSVEPMYVVAVLIVGLNLYAAALLGRPTLVAVGLRLLRVSPLGAAR